jgi:small-conductance mechanosensitive channel
MRRAARLFVPLTIAAATVVTAMLAAPPAAKPSGFDVRHLSLTEALSMIQQTAVMSSLLVVWLIAAIVLTLISGREIRYSSMEVRTSPLHCFALGLVAVTSFVLTAIVFDYLVGYFIGVPLLFALAVFAILTKIYGTIAVFHALGAVVAGARSRDDLARRRWLRGDLAMVIVGVLILGALRLIPIVGSIVWGFASVFAVGVALATKFGRREPWFLAWRPAEG